MSTYTGNSKHAANRRVALSLADVQPSQKRTRKEAATSTAWTRRMNSYQKQAKRDKKVDTSLYHQFVREIALRRKGVGK